MSVNSNFVPSSFLSLPLGECINSSPAGKRRIAAEKQLSQLADDGNLFNVDAALIDGGSLAASDGGSAMDQIKSPVTFAAAVAICSVAIIIFVTIFTALQVSALSVYGWYSNAVIWKYSERNFFNFHLLLEFLCRYLDLWCRQSLWNEDFLLQRPKTDTMHERLGEYGKDDA